MVRDYNRLVTEAQKALSIYGIDLAIKKEYKNLDNAEFMNTMCKEARERAELGLKNAKAYIKALHQSFYGVEIRVSGLDYLVSTVEEYERLVIPTL